MEEAVFRSDRGKTGRTGQCLRANPATGGLQSQYALLSTREQTASGVLESGRCADQFAPQGQLPLPQQAAVTARVGASAGVACLPQ
jgi:hypothetical protein